MAELPRGVAAAIKEYIVPHFDGLRAEVKVIGGQQDQMSKRLDDVAARLGEVAAAHLAEIHARIDQTNTRIDAAREELGARIDAAREELGARIDQQSARIDQTSSWQPPDRLDIMMLHD